MQSKYFNIKYTWIVAAALLACGLSACDADDDAAGGAVVLESFGPTGAKHGESIRFVGSNLDQVTAIEFVGATVEKSQFTAQSSAEIDLVVPEKTEAGKVTLKIPNGDITSKTELSFNVQVQVESVSAQAKPGETITIKGRYLNWVKEVWFTDDVMADEFVSQSFNELVVTVPLNAQTGPLSFYTGGTKPATLDWEGDDVIMELPAITSFSPTSSKRGDDLTITGTNLDLVAGILFKGSDEPVTEFKSQSETQIVVTIPNFTNKGKISLVSFSGLKVESATVLIMPLPPLEPLGKVVYGDALQPGWEKWGWGGSADLDNSDNVREGDKSIKVVYESDWAGPLQFAKGSMSTSGFTHLAISIYGTPGTGGKPLNLVAKGGDKDTFKLTIVEGEWTEYKVPLSEFGSPATITEIILQTHTWQGTVYVDAIGLR